MADALAVVILLVLSTEGARGVPPGGRFDSGHVSTSHNNEGGGEPPSADDFDESEILQQLVRSGRAQGPSSTLSRKFMLNLFRNLRRNATGQSERFDLRHSDTIRSFSAKAFPTNINQGRKIVFEFDIPPLPTNERIRFIEFRLLRSEEMEERRRHRLTVVVKRGKTRIRKVTRRYRPITEDNYNIFDITGIVGPWVNAQHGNLTIIVKERTRDDDDEHELVQAELQGNGNPSPNEALLVFYSQDKEFFRNIYQTLTADSPAEAQGGRSRGRRDSRKHRRRLKKARRDTPCGLYDFYIDFDVIGWGQWIIYPKHFNAHLCRGECPSSIDLRRNPTNHAMLQSLMRMKNPRLAPMPCCVPTKLRPVSMLYFEFDEIVVRHHEDMVAEECGCR